MHVRSNSDSLNFLDITIMVKREHLTFNWYQKLTFSERFLNYFSNHSVSEKRDNF